MNFVTVLPFIALDLCRAVRMMQNLANEFDDIDMKGNSSSSTINFTT